MCLARCAIYRETCEIRTSLGQAKCSPNSEVSSFQGAICTKRAVWDQMRCPYFTGCPHFAGLLFTGFIVNDPSVIIITLCWRLFCNMWLSTWLSGGQDILVGKALDYRPKGTRFDPRLDHKRRSTGATNSFSM
jgi:hypothetical protein